MSKNDLQSDLLADLQGAVSARPLPAAGPSVPPIAAGVLPRPTPAIELRVTPLRWSWPRLVGQALRVGPVQVSLSLR